MMKLEYFYPPSKCLSLTHSLTHSLTRALSLSHPLPPPSLPPSLSLPPPPSLPPSLNHPLAHARTTKFNRLYTIVVSIKLLSFSHPPYHPPSSQTRWPTPHIIMELTSNSVGWGTGEDGAAWYGSPPSAKGLDVRFRSAGRSGLPLLGVPPSCSSWIDRRDYTLVSSLLVQVSNVVARVS